MAMRAASCRAGALILLSISSVPKLGAFHVVLPSCYSGLAAASRPSTFSWAERAASYSSQYLPNMAGARRSPDFSAILQRAAPVVVGAGLIWRSQLLHRFWHSSAILRSQNEQAEHAGIFKERRARNQYPKPSLSHTAKAQVQVEMPPVFREMNGILAVHKPRNWTSFDVVAKVRSTLGKRLRDIDPSLTPAQCRIKVGHGGTLDPDATGVLVIGVGKGTKLMDLYTKGSKGYEAIGLFGFETDMGDAVGVQIGEALPYDHVSQQDLEGALAGFIGDTMQVPPIYSAIKKDGKKAYELARKGVEVTMEPRLVRIYSVNLTRPSSETKPDFHLSIECGGGTYIRSLVRDIARKLGCAAHMRALVRSKQGSYLLEDCVGEDALGDADQLLAALKRCESKAQHLPLP